MLGQLKMLLWNVRGWWNKREEIKENIKDENINTTSSY